ncbi:hypothetical protein EP7_003452 [Isosphaeraceae bacterium EP7]
MPESMTHARIPRRTRCILPLAMVLCSAGHAAAQDADAKAPTVPQRGWTAYLADPRTAVLVTLALVIGLGGGRQVLQGFKARGAVDRLAGDRPDLASILEASRYGRAGLIDLYRLLDEGKTSEIRNAAGEALSALWKADMLIAEEEKGLVRRGYRVDWSLRRRYPRGLEVAFPVSVSFGVPFLAEGGDGLKPSNLEWSYRVMGTERAALESYSEWAPGPISARFELNPGDFQGEGTHRLVLHARARTKDLTEQWQLDLPQVNTSFEFDRNLAVDALLTMPDDTRGEAMQKALTLVPSKGETTEPDGSSAFLTLNREFVLRDPPLLRLTTPLPSELAHRAYLEFEGIDETYEAGQVVFAGTPDEPKGEILRPIGPIAGTGVTGIDAPGLRRLRVVLRPDPQLGWSDPTLRSIWPGTIVTDWVEVRVIRR